MTDAAWRLLSVSLSRLLFAASEGGEETRCKGGWGGGLKQTPAPPLTPTTNNQQTHKPTQTQAPNAQKSKSVFAPRIYSPLPPYLFDCHILPLLSTLCLQGAVYKNFKNGLIGRNRDKGGNDNDSLRDRHTNPHTIITLPIITNP